MSTETRPAAVAGMFYPADAATLARTVAAHLSQAGRPDGEVQPKMLLVPHAGFIYSGPVAAHAYALLARWRDRIRRVVLLGPGHRVAVRGLAAPQATRFETPLGSVPVDTAALAQLADLPQVGASDTAHAQEHSLEVQLPFLQAVLAPGFTVVPLVVGRTGDEDVAQVLERLWGGDETLIVISSDLSHYQPYADAQAVDRATIDHVLALDLAFGHDQACGATPLRGALLQARRHGLGARLLDLRNSGDTAGDRARVVGYASVAFEPQASAHDEPGASGRGEPAAAHRAVDQGAAPEGAHRPPLPEALADGAPSAAARASDRALGLALLTRAHNAIARVLGRPTVNEPPHPALASPGATFVTLQRNQHLRGCIGTLQAERPLLEDVRHNALAAAFRDPRFEPLSADEWPGLKIEVSLLEPAQPMPAFATEADALAALVPQQDGVILEWRGHRATFLPQVWEQLPRPQAFMAALKRKAGLPPDFWADDVRLSRYRVRKFQGAPLGG